MKDEGCFFVGPISPRYKPILKSKIPNSNGRKEGKSDQKKKNRRGKKIPNSLLNGLSYLAERKRKTLAMASKVLRRVVAQIANARSRSYYTSRTKKPSLYSKISPLGNPSTSVVPELDDWVYKGNKVRVAELQRIVRDLRKRRRFAQALEVAKKKCPLKISALF